MCDTFVRNHKRNIKVGWQKSGKSYKFGECFFMKISSGVNETVFAQHRINSKTWSVARAKSSLQINSMLFSRNVYPCWTVLHESGYCFWLACAEDALKHDYFSHLTKSSRFGTCEPVLVEGEMMIKRNQSSVDKRFAVRVLFAHNSCIKKWHLVNKSNSFFFQNGALEFYQESSPAFFECLQIQTPKFDK